MDILFLNILFLDINGRHICPRKFESKRLICLKAVLEQRLAPRTICPKTNNNESIFLGHIVLGHAFRCFLWLCKMTKHICVRKEKKLLNLLKVKYSYISLDGVTVEEAKKGFFSKKFKTHGILYLSKQFCYDVFNLFVSVYINYTCKQFV